MSIAQASYMTESSSLRRAKRSMTAIVLSAFIAMLAVVSGFTTVASSSESSQGQMVQAGWMGILCSSNNGLGNNMDPGPWDSGMGIPHREASGRSWTAQEAFGSNIAFVNYHGEGEAKDKWFVEGVEKERGKAVSPDAWSANISKYEELRSADTCLLKMGVNAISNVGISFAGGISRIAQIFAVYAFDSNIICKEAGSTQGGCIDLLKIIGGPDVSGASTQGLIGTLTSGVYLPLLVIIVCLSGLWVAYRGIVQRKFRDAMFGAVWIFLSVIFGLTFLYKPSILAKAPMAVSNTVAACVIGGYTGNSCWDGATGGGGPTTDGTLDSKKMCKSSASGLPVTEQMSMAVNGLSCSIWEAFVLEPVAQGSFGRSVDELNIKDPVVSAAISKAKISPNDFCVNLASSASADGMKGTLKLDSTSNQVCNLAVYQAYLQTNAESGADKSNQTASTPDTRWYKLIDVVASDPGMWAKWSPDGAGNRILITFVANVAAALGSFVIIVIAFFALMYYLTSILMITFAPLFFLIGVHPGRGRSILIGWTEIVISNVLKYMASAFFLIITIAFYAAVLGSAKNVGLSLLFILVLTGALFLYRKEIVNLIGKVNMGGERLSNTATQKLEKLGERGKRMATSVGGSAIGAAVSADHLGTVMDTRKNIREKGWAEGLKTTGADLRKANQAVAGGARDGMMRELKRGHGVVANATRSFDRISQDNKRDLNQEANVARNDANAAEKKLSDVEPQRHEAQRRVTDTESVIQSSAAMYQTAEKKENERRDVDDKVVEDMISGMGQFDKMELILNRIAALKAQKASMKPDDVRMPQVNAEIERGEAVFGTLKAKMPGDTAEVYGASYVKMRDSAYERAGVSDEDIRSGRVSLKDATAKRNEINQMTNEMFLGSAPVFNQLEGTMHRLDALKMERDIAKQSGNVAEAESFQKEINGLEKEKNRLQGAMDTTFHDVMRTNLDNMKDSEYKKAGLAYTTANAEASNKAFVDLAANQKTAEANYKNAVNDYNTLTDARNKHVADAAVADQKAHILQKAVQDMAPGSAMTSRQAQNLRHEAGYQGEKAADKAQAGAPQAHVAIDTTLLADRRLPTAPEAAKLNVNDAPPQGRPDPATPGMKGLPRTISDDNTPPPSPPAVGPGPRMPDRPNGPDSGPRPLTTGDDNKAPKSPEPAVTAVPQGKVEPVTGTIIDAPNTAKPQSTVNNEGVTVVPGKVESPVVETPRVVATPSPTPAEPTKAKPVIVPGEVVETSTPRQNVTPQPPVGGGGPSEPSSSRAPEVRTETVVKETVTRETVAPTPTVTPSVTPPVATPPVVAGTAPLPPTPGGKEPAVKETVREVVRENPPAQTPAPAPAAPRDVAPSATAGIPTAPPKETVREVIRETPAPPAASPKASEVREAPVQQAASSPRATTPEVREVVREVPSQQPSTPTPKAPEVRETVREVHTPQAPTPQAPPASTPSTSPEVREVVRETVREVPATSPPPAPTPEVRERPAQQVSAPEVREVIREVPTSQTPEVREVIRETVREVPAPQAAPEVREVVRETVREVPASTPAPEVREVVREAPAPQAASQTASSSSGRDMSDDQIRRMVQEKGEALSARERATLEETLRTAKLAQPNSDGSNNSTLQRAAESARRDLDSMTAKMAAADARHASERANLEARLAASERSTADAQRAARDASQAAAEARRGHGIPTAAPQESNSSSRRDNEQSRDRDANAQPAADSAQQTNSSTAQNQQASNAPASDADRPQGEDRPDAVRPRFGRRNRNDDNPDGRVDYTAPRPRR